MGTLGWSRVTQAVLCGECLWCGTQLVAHSPRAAPAPGELQSSAGRGDSDAAVSAQGRFDCRSPTCVSS